MSRFVPPPVDTFVSSLDIAVDDATRYGPATSSISTPASSSLNGVSSHQGGPTAANHTFINGTSSNLNNSTTAQNDPTLQAQGGASRPNTGRASKTNAIAALASANAQAQALSSIVSPAKNASSSSNVSLNGHANGSAGTTPTADSIGAKTFYAHSAGVTASNTPRAGSEIDDGASVASTSQQHLATGTPAALNTSTPQDGRSASKNPARKYNYDLPRAPPLDFDTIRTHAPRTPTPPARPRSKPTRMFGLQHAPVYHPTIEEFAKPMEYIERISLEAKQWGICKVVPPEGWRPPFALNTETFRFTTRLQQLNSMEATARASLNFLEQLYLFHRQQGSVGIHIPTVAGKPMDMFRLKREVTNLGGYVNVTNNRKWTSVAKALGYNTSLNNTVCSQLKTSYLKIIQPFENFVERSKLGGKSPPPEPKILNDDVPILPDLNTPKQPANSNSNGSGVTAENGLNIDTNSDAMELDPTIAPVPESDAAAAVRTASNKFNEAMQHNDERPDDKIPAVKLGGLLSSKDPKKVSDHDEPTGDDSCEICKRDHDPERIVLCDGCDRGYHLDCLTPPLAEVPKSQFFCEKCLLSNGADYGFDEGEEHSLFSFRRRADAFKRKWLQDHPLPRDKGKSREGAPGKGYAYVNAAGEPVAPPPQDELAEQILMEDHFEREFWRLVESPNETVEIEYGADVNHTNDGGGLPSLEIHPGDPYSKDGWNLNNLPILAGSLLRYIKSDISGMTIPWIYVGMVFSTFAWHKEDHYTYSINYHHFGDTKTWYGIPGEDDEKLEAAMKLAAPELFDQSPDLLWQLVTLMSPGRLKKHGVRVCACDQRPNEFVITFPRAYHSGFNHGFNFNEAVNFALPDWLPTGLQCVERYRSIAKNPVFSHDELVVTISQHEKSSRASRWLLPSYKEMVDRELAARKQIRELLPGMIEGVDPTELNEEEYQCGQCKVLCFLSQILSHDMQYVACLDHYESIPDVDAKHPLQMRLKYSDDDLAAMLARVKTRSDKAGKFPTDILIGPIEPPSPIPASDLRTTGRKRKPSALALEAAEGEDLYHDSIHPRSSSMLNGRSSQRAKIEPTNQQPSMEVAPIA